MGVRKSFLKEVTSKLSAKAWVLFYPCKREKRVSQVRKTVSIKVKKKKIMAHSKTRNRKKVKSLSCIRLLLGLLSAAVPGRIRLQAEVQLYFLLLV